METKLYPIPQTGYLRLTQIIGDSKKGIPAIIPVSRSTWLRGVEDEFYPSPVKLAKSTVAWRVEDILKLIDDLNDGHFK